MSDSASALIPAFYGEQFSEPFPFQDNHMLNVLSDQEIVDYYTEIYNKKQPQDWASELREHRIEYGYSALLTTTFFLPILIGFSLASFWPIVISMLVLWASMMCLAYRSYRVELPLRRITQEELLDTCIDQLYAKVNTLHHEVRNLVGRELTLQLIQKSDPEVVLASQSFQGDEGEVIAEAAAYRIELEQHAKELNTQGKDAFACRVRALAQQVEQSRVLSTIIDTK